MSAELTVVIYDGKCDFCKASLGWLRMKLDVTAISFHEGNLEKYGLTKAECEKEVIVLDQGRRYGGVTSTAVP
jgi:predicted DCC family thiol-disulfide oxidoreductase YuxK